MKPLDPSETTLTAPEWVALVVSMAIMLFLLWLL